EQPYPRKHPDMRDKRLEVILLFGNGRRKRQPGCEAKGLRARLQTTTGARTDRHLEGQRVGGRTCRTQPDMRKYRRNRSLETVAGHEPRNGLSGQKLSASKCLPGKRTCRTWPDKSLMSGRHLSRTDTDTPLRGVRMSGLSG